jgi:polysaccharide transporter, PST family
MFSRRVLLENMLSLAALQVLNYAAPLITLPYLARVLQPQHFGLLSYAQGIILYFDLFTDFGFNFSASRAISQCRGDAQAVSQIFWSTLVAKVFLMSLSGAALMILVRCLDPLRPLSELFAANSLYLIGTTIFPIWLFQGLEQLKLAALFMAIGRLLTVPALLLLVKSQHDTVIAAAVQASVELSAGLLSAPLVYMRMNLVWYRPTIRDIIARLREGWPLFLSASAFQVGTSSTTVILGALSGQMQVGYYSAADKLIKAATGALSPIGQALYPRISAVQAISPQQACRLIQKSLYLTTFVGSVLSISVFACANFLCREVLGSSFAHAAVVIRYLSPVPLLFGLMGVLGTQTMLAFGLDALFCKLMLASIGLGIPLTVVLVNGHGAIGAAIATDILLAGIVAAMFGVLLANQSRVWKREGESSVLAAENSVVG